MLNEKEIPRRKRKITGSSAINAIGYDPKTEVLTIYFNSDTNKGYDYPNVPIQEVRDFFKAASKGQFYHKRLKKYGHLY